MTALMAYSEYKKIKGELKDIETAFDMGQKVAFAYMADGEAKEPLLQRSATFGHVSERGLRKGGLGYGVV